MNIEFKLCLETLNNWAKQRGIHYKLDHMHSALALLQNPHQKLAPIIHIAGTNGKGSTLRFLSTALQSLGYKVGTFSSPHLHCYTERICINDTPISEQEFTLHFKIVENALKNHLRLCEFEYLCCLAFVYFAKQNLDYIILETGLGGRLDATNVCQAKAVVITSIGYDHQDILGNNISDIAAEKAGIITHSCPVFTPNSQKDIVKDRIFLQAQKKQCLIHFSNPLHLDNKPAYQADNAGLALATLQYLHPLTKHQCQDIHHLFNQCSITGRYDQKKINNQTYLFDGAHNPSAIQLLCDSLIANTIKNKINPNDILIVLAIQNHKDAKTMCELIEQYPFKVGYLATPDNRFWPFETIKTFFLKQKLQPFLFSNTIKDNYMIVFTGSLYWVADAYAALKVLK